MMRFTEELIKFSLSEAAGATYWIIVECLKEGKKRKMTINNKSNRKIYKLIHSFPTKLNNFDWNSKLEVKQKEAIGYRVQYSFHILFYHTWKDNGQLWEKEFNL